MDFLQQTRLPIKARSLTPILKRIHLFLVAFLVSHALVHAQQLAFPTAEGFGRFATGGRNGTVYHVTNLNDAGVGSFRDAVSKSNRTVIFDVGGLIRITTRVIVASNITIAGQTAPGDGICIYGNGLSFSNANNTIVRYIRIRMGINGDSGKDAIAIASGSNMIFDHVSVSWGRDGTFDINPDSGREIKDITIQNCIIAQGLETHSTGGLMQTTGGISALRNLYIDNNTRNPKVKGINQFVNNVVYNWKVGAYILGDSEGPSAANVSNNYFINGPTTASAAFTRGNLNFHLFAENNFQDANKDGVLNGFAIPQSSYGTVAWEPQPYPYPTVTQLNPVAAYHYVLAHAGASKQRDQVDARLVTELTSLGTLGQTISNENNAPMSGPGTIRGGTAPADTDQDGIPNNWEIANGLNPSNAADGSTDADNDGYTNVEEYLHELAGDTTPSSSTTLTIQENTLGFCSLQGTIDNNNAGFTGTGFANANNAIGAGISWQVFATVAGTHTLTWRHANGTTTARTATLLINGVPVVATMSFAPTSSWTTWTEVAVNIPLGLTSSTIRLQATSASGLSNIDYLKITGPGLQSVNCAGSIRLGDTQENSNAVESTRIVVSPNPSASSFVLKVPGAFSYVVTNYAGKEMESGQGNDQRSIGSQLPQGLYLIKIQVEGKTRVIKVVKQ